ncbi:CaiB/BaiF CoA transferase family protein [Alicyclobacillus sp. ALC3]|uniref:CaiB/BaiF CoA transferase family protein n=1 Tax=Alicyclobacillus sp. ALC3 TaxID=2796143 RepID=UPI00237806D1|nr:CoA transferase [Alicyclobacillus sp. ALC3]WDL97688.1 CoA transferase [Alicyclobacillus sp. ALC3]
MTKQILKDVVVIDMSTILAAPLTASLLSDFGATVIKIEEPDGGDPVRQYAPSKSGISLQNKVINRNKRSVAVDLRHEQGREIIRRLAKQADAVVTNFRVPTLKEWGLDYEQLCSVKQDIVMLHLSAFGRTGPYRERPGFARVAEAYSGLAYMTGYPDRTPMFSGYPIADGVGGVFGAFSLMLALYERSQSGQGQLIDLGLYEPMLKMMEGQVISYDQVGLVPERIGTRHRDIAPNDLYRCKDGKWVVLPASTPNMFRRLCVAIGKQELANDARFITNSVRVENRSELDSVLQDFFIRFEANEVCTRLQQHGVAATEVYSIQDIIGDEHIHERGNLIRVFDEELGEAPLIQGVVPRLSKTPGNIHSLAESLGQSTRAVLEELGYTETSIRQLGATGVVRI